MSLKKTAYKAILLVGASSLLLGCFHLRSEKTFPQELKCISFNTDDVYSELTVNLTRKLRASGVTLNNCSNPALTILLRNTQTNTDIPVIFDSLQGTVYTYTVTVRLELTNQAGKPIFNSTLNSTQQIMHNVNQVSAPVFTPLMRRTLMQRLADTIYNIIISTDIQKAVSTKNVTHKDN